jgi:predicted RNA-binding protein with TRAM domain
VAFARAADAPVHVVHLSSADALRHVREAKALGLPVSAETCPAYLALTVPLVHYRLAGLSRAANGAVEIKNRVIAKISRLEMAQKFLEPAPTDIIKVLLEQGKLEALQPSAPVEEGQAIELKLVEVGLHDAGAGVGKIDGVDIVVANAAKLVGKKVKATIGRVLDGVAFATLADSETPSAGVTFEAEAEKPTRAPSRRKTAAPTDGESPDMPEAAAEIQEEAAVPEPVGGGAAADGPPKKKRTRRGTRGGRSRPKAQEPAGAAADPDTAAEVARPTPRIHLPSTDLGVEDAGEDAGQAPTSAEDASDVATADGQPKKKKTRRGTRGGRKRRKPAADGQADAAVSDNGSGETMAEPVEVAAEEPSADVPEEQAAEPPGEYVPMAEWIDEFDSRAPTRPRAPKS